jgi:hypothetical protein
MFWFGYGLWRLRDFRFRIGGGIGKCCTHGITHGAVRLINALCFYFSRSEGCFRSRSAFGPEERCRQGP